MKKIHFYVRFSTRYGQALYLNVRFSLPSGETAEQTLEMEYLDETFWTYSLEKEEYLHGTVRYHYLLKDTDGTIQSEGCDGKCIELDKIAAGEISVTDTWNFEGAPENAWYTAPFQKVLLPMPPAGGKPLSYRGGTHVFKVKAPLLKKNEVLGLLGSDAATGEWNPRTPCRMRREGMWWTVKLNLSGAGFPVAYKYAIFDAKTRELLRYEDGSNRLLPGTGSRKSMSILHDGFIRLPDRWRGAGVAIPVFSLRSRKSMGIGEFADIRLLADWAHSVGLKLIQLLPVNDTTDTGVWMDSYPYNAVSAFALHPVYLHLDAVAGEQDAPLLRAMERKRKQLNALAEVDYEAVLAYKWKIIRQLYTAQRTRVFASEGFKQFVAEHADWLIPYAAFCSLRNSHATADFSTWQQHRTYDEKAVQKLVYARNRRGEEARLHLFVQYHLHLQLKSAVAYARQKGIVVKGDIAIGVSRNSCDVWMHPELFHTDRQAGAPPDAFAAHGQNWGFPTYNWQQMRATGFDWWRKRFTQMSHYFDLFRLDHLLGFFRIWSIPADQVDGSMGRFVPAIPVHINEFAQKGISFEYDRFCSPWITDPVLEEILGEGAPLLHPFLQKKEDGRWELKPAFATQRQIRDHFAGLPVSEENQQLEQALFHLVSNVLVFEEGAGGQDFHFRIGMEATSSFRHLDGHTQYALRQLYHDYFFRRQDAMWAAQAAEILGALKASTDMLICGEDLGMVPACVPEVMHRLGILSLEVQRMPKQAGWDFFHPALAPYLSVVTPGTHDMSTLRGWWEENREMTQRFFNHQLQHPGLAPYFCEPWVNKAILIQHLYAPAMWCIIQWQDVMGIDGKLRRQMPGEERINVPAMPRYYWRYRMHITLEQLLQEKDLRHELASYVQLSGR